MGIEELKKIFIADDTKYFKEDFGQTLFFEATGFCTVEFLASDVRMLGDNTPSITVDLYPNARIYGRFDYLKCTSGNGFIIAKP